MAWTVEFEDSAARQLEKLDRPTAKRILTFLRTRLAGDDDPRRIGSRLKGVKLGDLWRYRVGDYRIIAAIEDRELRVLVVKIGHRRDVYG